MDEDISKLFELVKQGDLQGLKDMVADTEVKKRKRDSILDSLNDEGETVLHIAAQCNHPVIIRWLLSEGGGRSAGFTNVLAKTTREGMTAMHVAAFKGHLECCQALVEGSHIDNAERAEMLNAVANEGWSVLHLAAQNGHTSIIRWLLSSSSGGGGRAAGFTMVLAKDKNGLTAMHRAALEGYLESCQALVEGCNIENRERAKMLNAIETEDRWSVLHFAVSAGHPSIIRWLLSSCEGGGRAAGFTMVLAKTDEGRTALYLAAEYGHLECCQALVEGSNIDNGERDELLNDTNSFEMTPLHIAAHHGHSSIIRWLLSSSEGGGRAAGFTNVLARTKRGITAMHLATRFGHLECCQALVEGSKIDNGERADLLNAVDKYEGWTVLHYAAQTGHTSMIQWLLSSEEGGGRAAGFTSSSITAIAIDSRSVLHLVAESGKVDALNTLLSGCTVGERLTLFLSVDEHGWTLLHEAARQCRADVIRELLLHHPETQTIVDARDHRGMTALHRAVIGGSKKEWGRNARFGGSIAQAAVVEALLITPKKKDNDVKQQQTKMEDDDKPQPQEQEQEQQQASVHRS